MAATDPLAELARQLAALEKELEGPERTRAISEVCRILTEAMRPAGEVPILVGGAAVEFYTGGQYRTGDFDFVAPFGQRAEEALRALGFERRGRSMVHPDLELWVEFPGATLAPGERFESISLGETSIRIVSLPDLLADRIRALVHWKSPIDGLNAVRLAVVHGTGVLSETGTRLNPATRELEGLERVRSLVKRIEGQEIEISDVEEELESWVRSLG